MVADLPEMPRKILAMYYFEHMRLAEIAKITPKPFGNVSCSKSI